MKNLFVSLAAVVFSFVLICNLASCQIGLGDSVDTEAPTVNITYPEASDVISANVLGSIKVSGTWNDDQCVKSVTINVVNTLTGEGVSGIQADIDKKAKTWEATLDYKRSIDDKDYSNYEDTNGYSLADGTYQVTVVAKDNSGHSSGENARTFDIDNTAPVFALTSPNSTDKDDATSYGTILKFEGDVSDDHSIKDMTIYVYNEEGVCKTLDGMTFSKVETTGGTSIVAAQYESADEELKNFYESIYDLSKKGSTQTFYSVITLTDAAGNTSSCSYIKDKVIDLVTSLMSDSLSESEEIATSDIKKILNGTYTHELPENITLKDLKTYINGCAVSVKDNTQESSSDSGASLAITEDEEGNTNYLAFTLNSNANPTYEIVGYNYEDNLSEASSDSTLNIKVASGLNGYKVKPEGITVKLYQAELENGSLSKVSEDAYAVITGDTLSVQGQESVSGVYIYNRNKKPVSEITTSVSQETYTIKLPSLVSRKIYIVEAEGYDTKAQELTASEGNTFAFRVSYTGTSPSVAFDDSSEINVKDMGYTGSAKIAFTGTVSSDCALLTKDNYTEYDNKKYSQYKVTATNEDNSSDNYTWSGDILFDSEALSDDTIDSEKEYSWNIEDISKNMGESLAEKLLNGSRYIFSFELTFLNAGNASKTLNRNIHVDTQKPVVSLNKPTPLVTKNNNEYLNGKITLKCSIDEANMEKLGYSIVNKLISDSEETVVEEIKKGEEIEYTLSSFSKEIDTSTLKDNSILAVKFWALDKAGNESEEVEQEYNINQSTDAPVVKASNATAGTDITLSKNVNMFGIDSNNTLNYTITDDDGFKEYTIGYRLRNTENEYTKKTVTLDKDVESYTDTYDLPAEEGEYEIVFEVSDKLNETTYSSIPENSSYIVAVDESSPEITFITEQNGYAGQNTDFTIQGTVIDGCNAIDLYIVNGTEETLVGNYKNNEEWKYTLSTTTVGQTIKFKAVDKYSRENTVSYTYKIDSVAPEFNITNAELIDNKLITEKSSYYKTDSYWVQDKDNLTLTESSDMSSGYYYLVRGTWSDTQSNIVNGNETFIDGSGTSSLMYSWDFDSSLEESEAISKATWYTVNGLVSAQKATQSWNFELPVEQGLSKNLTLIVYDGSNNYKIKTVKNFGFDFESPLITLSKPSSPTKTPDEVTVTVKDTYGIEADKVTIDVKNPDGNSITTYTSTAEESVDGEYKVLSYKVNVPSNAGDGEWIVSVKAQDKAERWCAQSSDTTNASFILDSKGPETITYTSKYPLVIQGSTINDGITSINLSDIWFNTDNIKIEGYYTDKTTEVEKIYYWINQSITDAEKSINTATELTPELKESGIYKFTGNAVVESGKDDNTVIFAAVDKAGNYSTLSSYTIKADKKSPEITTATAADVNIASENAVINIECSDADGENKYSGIKTLTLKKGNTEILSKDISSEEGNSISLTFDKSKLSDGENILIAYVTDNAQNQSDGKSVTVNADFTVPQIKYTSPVSSDIVNKKITLSGTMSDNLGLSNEDTKKPVLQYCVQNNNGEYNDWESSSIEVNITGTVWSFEDFNTEDLYNEKESKNIKVRVIATDAFDNSNTDESGINLTINQNYDRSEIELTNIKTSGSVLKASSIYGTIKDDDGINGLWYIEKSDYDKMTTKVYPTLSDANGWTKIKVDSTNWSCDVEEGTKEWYFCVLDSENTYFCTADSSVLSRPYIKDSTLSEKTDNNSSISFTVDQTAPVITMYVSPSGIDGTWKTAGQTFGGNSSTMYIKLNVIETVGMSSDIPGIKIAGNAVNNIELNENVTGCGSKEDPYVYMLKPLTLGSSDYSEGSVQVTASLKDESGQEGNGFASIMIDNSAPSVSILSPGKEVSDAVTSSITVKGIVTDDYSSVSKLEWTIPYKESLNLENAWQTIEAVASWEIKFTSGSDDTTDSLIYYATESNTYDVSSVDSSEGIYNVPIWFRATDSLGNTDIIKTQYVLADIEGGKPKAWITSPENESTTSGVVTIYGGASDDISVGKVELQIDVNNDGLFDDKDYALLQEWSSTSDELKANLGGTSSDWYITASGTNSWKRSIDTNCLSYTEGDDLYLRIKVRAWDEEDTPNTRSWTSPVKVTIDSEVPVIKGLKLVQFGKDITPEYNTKSITEREYVSGMYISNRTVSENGKWYLTGTVSDNSQVSFITLSALSSTTTTVQKVAESNVLENYAVSASSDSDNKTEYKIFIPLETESSGSVLSGMYYFTLQAKDDGNGSCDTNIKVNLDSTAPGMYTKTNSQFIGNKASDNSLRVKSLSKVVGNTASNSTVVNSNGYFTFGDTVQEEGSGLEYVAFFFERAGTDDDGNAQIRYYDPLESSNNKYIKDTDVVCNDDGLPVVNVSVTKATGRTTEDSITLSNDYGFVRKGGLIKIGGIYARITNVNDKTISFEPGVSQDFVNAQLVLSQIVDHLLTESDDGTGNVTNDDGDSMIESLTQIGTNYTWSASLNSQTIPDGPVYVKACAIDNAGNITLGSVLTSVTNNRPRITKVFIGTDLNNSGTYEFRGAEAPVTSINEGTADGLAYGEFSYYSAINKTTGESQYNVKLNSSDFKVKNGLCVLPEFTGGNVDLDNEEEMKYAVSISESDSQNNIAAEGDSLLSMDRTLSSVVNKGDTNILSSQISDFGGVIIPSSDFESFEDDEESEDSVKYVLLTFWDATKETVQGSTSQWAHLRIPVIDLTTDTSAPEPAIKPFYWNGETDNSVYVNNAIAGHIELENDLTDDIKNYKVSSTELGSDPKVSGKFILKGSVSDDCLLSSLTMNIFGNSATVATYTKGSWVNKTSLPACLESLTVTDTDLSQNGHTVSFSAVINTESLSTVTGLDKYITVGATDWKDNSYTVSNGVANKTEDGNTTTESIVSTTSDKNTALYVMDIVPYVKAVTTHLSSFYASAPSVYARTALGNYPVYEGEVIQFTGYNLGTNKASVTINGMSSTVLKNGTVGGSTVSNTITLTKSTSSSVTGAKSGEVSLTVNSIPALNNYNKDDAMGSCTKAQSDYSNCYNRQPNKVNNNTLTDKLYLDVWQFKNAAEPVSGGAKYVHMKINPKTGIPGFSFANSILYFNMPGYNSNGQADDWRADDEGVSGSQYSQIPVGMNYGGFSYNTMAFDNYGYSYAAAMCTDTQTANKSAYFQFFSRESPIPYNTLDQNMNYHNAANCSRLDSSSIALTGNDSGWTTEIERIQSPAMETSHASTNAPSSSCPTYIFMAYYDKPVKQVRFRWGTVGSQSDYIDGRPNHNESPTFSHTGKDYGLSDIQDEKYTGAAQYGKSDGGNRNSASDSYIKYSYSNNSGLPVQVVASSGVSGARSAYTSATSHKAGQYVDLAIVGKDTSSPVAVVTWYDEENGQLCMAYNAKPTTSNSWTSRVIDSNGGINVKVAVDGDNGLHFAYYDNKNGSNLKYAYMSSYSYTGTITPVVVDAYSSVGAKCTIDVAKVEDSSGTYHWVPYIGYQMSSYLGTSLAAKVAYRTDFTSEVSATTIPGGADSSDYVTGNWECSIVPTANIPNDDQINLGLYKTTAESNEIPKGAAQAFTSNTYWKTGDTAPGSTITNTSGVLDVGNATILHGNNTKNPIIGYGIDTGAIEMAQKK